MTVENLEKELKQEKLHSIYLFYGEETYLLENAVKKSKFKSLFLNCFNKEIKGFINNTLQ